MGYNCLTVLNLPSHEVATMSFLNVNIWQMITVYHKSWVHLEISHPSSGWCILPLGGVMVGAKPTLSYQLCMGEWGGEDMTWMISSGKPGDKLQ